jgi:hypothetical protein
MRLGAAALIAMLAATSAQAGPVVFASRVQLSSPRVTLGDIADLSGLPATLSNSAAALELTTVPPGRQEIVLSVQRSAERARALMPALQPWLADVSPGDIDAQVVRPAGLPAASARSCLVVEVALAAGAVATADDFLPDVCNAPPLRGAFRFDAASGTVRAARDLSVGDRVSMVPRADLASVLPGDRLSVTAWVGDVQVTRRVEVVQPAAAGRGVFVRTADNAVFAEPAPEGQP